MGNTEIFIIGLLIFATYMFFLLRMVSKQHEIQKNEENTILRTESYEKKNQKD
jgi:Ca2+/Na+ antiporter